MARAIKVAEVPPGPPVLQTLVVEVYGPDQAQQIALARQVKDIFSNTAGVVDVDWYVEDDQAEQRFEVDREKAALNGVSPEQSGRGASRWPSRERTSGCSTCPGRSEDVPCACASSAPTVPAWRAFTAITYCSGRTASCRWANWRALEKRTRTRASTTRTCCRSTMSPATWPGARKAPSMPSCKLADKIDRAERARRLRDQAVHRAPAAFPPRNLPIKWDGEWHITYEVFRDMGLAFAVVLVLIYILVVGWFQSMSTPLVIMAPIPLSLVGILPAHWLMGAFFTATSMIGFIAGAGIVVRNSIILVDFIELRLKQGMPLAEAVVDAGAVRFRPMMLTAAAVVVGAAVILFDPIFQGLALSLMAGEVASTLLSRMAVPVLYYMSERGGQ